ncbi:hypothetical protein PQ43W_43 [Ralstonia phage PQ43W]
MTAALNVSEDAVFSVLWGWLASLFDPSVSDSIFKGYANMTAAPAGGNYVVISPGVLQRQDQGDRTYDPANGLINVGRRAIYSYQVDCYGPQAPDYANIITVAWNSIWTAEQLSGGALQALYADEPVQLNITNGEMQYEQRFMCKLFAQVNHSLALPQGFFVGPVPLAVKKPADLL